MVSEELLTKATALPLLATDLPVSLSHGAEQRDDASPVGLRHGRALLQQQAANLQLPPTRRCGQSWKREAATSRETFISLVRQ